MPGRVRIGVVLVLLALLGAGCAGRSASGPPPQVAPIRSATVPVEATPPDEAKAEEARASYIAHALAGERIVGLDGLRRVGLGTGFYVAPDKLLTNFHVAGVCTRLTVANGVEGKETVATVIAGDETLDLAVLETSATVAAPARFEALLYTETGDDLAIVGYPEHGLTVLRAELSPVVAREVDLVSDQARFQFRGVVRRGNSGSPVLDDSGAVLGVVTAKVDTPAIYQRTGNVVDNIGFAISNRIVFDFLHQHRIDPLPAVAGPSLDAAQLLERAHGFVRQIGCWR